MTYTVLTFFQIAAGILLRPNKRMDGYILAGGLSRRMGKNKAGLRLGERTFLERAAAALSAVAETVRVVGDLRGEATDLAFIPDETPNTGTRASIVGLLTALRHARSEWAAVLACDLPFVTGGLMVRLSEIAESDPQAACVVPVQPDGPVQPLCGLYRASECLGIVEELFGSGEWRLQRMFSRVNARLVPFDEIKALPGAANFFFNVNTESDYQKAVGISRMPSFSDN
jgi:molybdopterin-guanine dinucleotide biosynthesis protein A